jgi:hypothetical protein
MTRGKMLALRATLTERKNKVPACQRVLYAHLKVIHLTYSSPTFCTVARLLRRAPVEVETGPLTRPKDFQYKDFIQECRVFAFTIDATGIANATQYRR